MFLLVVQTALYLYASTSNTIIESHKNATIIVLRSGCEQLAPHPIGQNMAATKPRDLTPAGT